MDMGLDTEINIHNKGLNFDLDLDTDLDPDLDTDWIEEFESLDDKYKMFYKENINNIKFKYVYVDKDNNIEKIKEEILLLKQINLISREEMIEIIKKNCSFIDKTFSVLSILKYNFDVEPSDINHYMKENDSLLTLIKNIDNIPLNKTIQMFQDMNEIIIIFYEKTNHQKNLNITKKIFIRDKNADKNMIKRRKTYRKKT
jgi:hypothetical protein